MWNPGNLMMDDKNDRRILTRNMKFPMDPQPPQEKLFGVFWLGKKNTNSMKDKPWACDFMD